jgi:hypothetical protein
VYDSFLADKGPDRSRRHDPQRRLIDGGVPTLPRTWRTTRLEACSFDLASSTVMLASLALVTLVVVFGHLVFGRWC